MNATHGDAGSDADLVKLAQEGSADAFRVLVERHGRGIYRLTFRMTGNHQDAEDLVQETFLRASQQLGRFDGRAAFSTWLYRIATNCSLDLLRVRKARPVAVSVASPGEPGPLERVPAPAPSPERLSLSREWNRLLAGAMGQLSANERAAFVMRHHAGLSIEEIGRALDLGPSAAKHSIFRAVQKLRRVLEPALAAPNSRVAR